MFLIVSQFLFQQFLDVIEEEKKIQNIPKNFFCLQIEELEFTAPNHIIHQNYSGCNKKYSANTVKTHIPCAMLNYK